MSARPAVPFRRIAEWVLVAALLLSVRTCRRRLLARVPSHWIWLGAYAVTLVALNDPAALLDASPELAAAVPAISEFHRRAPWAAWAAELCLVTAFFGWMVATSYLDARLHVARLSQRQIGELRRKLKRLAPAINDGVRDWMDRVLEEHYKYGCAKETLLRQISSECGGDRHGSMDRLLALVHDVSSATAGAARLMTDGGIARIVGGKDAAAERFMSSLNPPNVQRLGSSLQRRLHTECGMRGPVAEAWWHVLNMNHRACARHDGSVSVEKAGETTAPTLHGPASLLCAAQFLDSLVKHCLPQLRHAMPLIPLSVWNTVPVFMRLSPNHEVLADPDLMALTASEFLSVYEWFAFSLVPFLKADRTAARLWRINALRLGDAGSGGEPDLPWPGSLRPVRRLATDAAACFRMRLYRQNISARHHPMLGRVWCDLEMFAAHYTLSVEAPYREASSGRMLGGILRYRLLSAKGAIMEGLYARGHDNYSSLCDVVDELRPYLWRVAVPETLGGKACSEMDDRQGALGVDRRFDRGLVGGWHFFDAGALMRTTDWVTLRLHRNATQLRAFIVSLSCKNRLSVLCALAQDYPADFQNVVLLCGWLLRTSEKHIVALPNNALENVSAYLGWRRRHQRYAQRGRHFPPAPVPKRFADYKLTPSQAKRIATVGLRGPGTIGLSRREDGSWRADSCEVCEL